MHLTSNAATDADAKWDVFNAYAVQLLLLNGASWERGPRTRGKIPKFHKVQASADQGANGDLASPHLLLLQSVLRSLRELELRFNRDVTGPGDVRACRNTQTSPSSQVESCQDHKESQGRSARGGKPLLRSRKLP